MDNVRIAIVDRHELVVAGLTHLLNRHSSRRYLIVPTHQRDPPPDVVLYSVDSVEQEYGHDPEMHDLLRSMPSTIIMTSWNDTSPAIEAALACGAHGTLSKTLTTQEFLEGVETIHKEQARSAALPPEGTCHSEISCRGLTPREVEVLKLIGAALTNQEIADRLYLSINSVKTYVRTAYRKIGVKRRTQAVVWVEHHGLSPPAPLSAVDRVEADLTAERSHQGTHADVQRPRRA